MRESTSGGEPLLLGIEIGGTKTQAVIGTADGAILERARFSVRREEGAEGIRRDLAKVLHEWCGRFTFAGVGVGFGGPVSWRTGQICCSVHVEGWSGFPLAQWLEEITGCRVLVENDANTAALAEARFGAGSGMSPVFYTNSGTGVGGGLILEGEIYHGAEPGEAEFGHLRLDQSGAIVEDVCSGRAVDARIRRLAAQHPASVLSKLALADPGGEARHLRAALQAGDAWAADLLHDIASALAFALSHVTHLFHPQAVVLGGGLSLLGEAWRGAVAKELPQFLMAAMQPGPAVLLSAFGEDVVPRGALELARRASTL
jgi:glucokinase